MNNKSPKIVTKALISFGTIVSSLLLSGCGRSVTDDTIISVTPEQLTVVEKDGESRTSYKVASDAMVTLNGHPARFEELGVGDVVEVETSIRDGEEVATAIEASSQAATHSSADPADVSPALPQQIEPTEALDTSLHGVPDLPAETETLLNPPPVNLNPEIGTSDTTESLRGE